MMKKYDNKGIEEKYKDSYDELRELIGREKFIEWGLKSCEMATEKMVDEKWNILLNKINNKEKVYIRGYGRNGESTYLYIDFYKEVLSLENIEKDPTNNSEPRKLIQDMTGWRINKNIKNYQVSHVWGRTKNIYLFTAPWNIAFVPKIIDPLTGHESNGALTDAFKERFQEEVSKKFGKYIEKYNNEIVKKLKSDKIQAKWKDYCNKLKNNAKDNKEINKINRFIKSVEDELFTEIQI